MNPSSEQEQTDTQDAAPPPVQGKQVYVKPAIIYSAPLEAHATNCHTGPGKADKVQCTYVMS